MDSFDAVYGASAGALNAAWLLSGEARSGLPGWTDPALRMATVRRRNLLPGRPLVDGVYLTDVVYEKLTPMPFERVLRATSECTRSPPTQAAARRPTLLPS